MWKSRKGLPRGGSCKQKHGGWSEQEAEGVQPDSALYGAGVCVSGAFKYREISLVSFPSRHPCSLLRNLNPACSTWTFSVWDL